MSGKSVEREIKIRIPDSKLYIYGTLRGSSDRPLVIFVHGLSGSRNEHIYYNGARALDKLGYATFRFDLYSSATDARKLENCTISIHAHDLDKVIDYLNHQGFGKIFCVGHSLGGPTILLSNHNKLSATVLWDPHHAYLYGFKKQGWEKITEIDRYRITWAHEVYIGEEMYRENNILDCDALASQFSSPTKIVYATKGELVGVSKHYYKKLNTKKDIIGIANATHCFDEEGTEEKLLSETVKWFDQF